MQRTDLSDHDDILDGSVLRVCREDALFGPRLVLHVETGGGVALDLTVDHPDRVDDLIAALTEARPQIWPVDKHPVHPKEAA